MSYFHCSLSEAWPQNFVDFDLLGYFYSGTRGFSMNRYVENINEWRSQIRIGFTEDFKVGHTWVADGYRHFVYNPPIVRYLIHCNFGWNGLDDGWFRVLEEDVLNFKNLYYTLYFDGFMNNAELDNINYTEPYE